MAMTTSRSYTTELCNVRHFYLKDSLNTVLFRIFELIRINCIFGNEILPKNFSPGSLK